MNTDLVDRPSNIRWSDPDLRRITAEHAFPEPDGSRRSRQDSTEVAFEVRRPSAEPAGQSRTRRRQVSGPGAPGLNGVMKRIFLQLPNRCHCPGDYLSWSSEDKHGEAPLP